MTQHEFKAEVQQLLDIVIHSLYSDREIFLRELLSNAADALDKAHFMGLTRTDLVGLAGDEPGIRIELDEEGKRLIIDDDGVGMTEAEAIENLGTIAHSGSKTFLKQLAESKGDAPSLIGQFGVGFYASYMVADEVTVESRSVEPDAKPILWRSRGDGTYAIEEGSRAQRGTRITLHFREDAEEYLAEHRLRAIVRKHSNFLPWPVMMEDSRLNEGEALWAKAPSEVSEEDANAFYKNIATDWQDPAFRVHAKVDSPLQYSAMLFIPSARPYDLFYPETEAGVRLYARRVLIMEQAKDIFPKWLRFVKGVVDSEDLQVNLSREMVQKTPVVRKIREALIKRLLKDLARLETREVEEGAEGPTPAERYAEIWSNFGMLIKEGYYHDKASYGELLLPLMRFNAVSHPDSDGLISLAAYKEAMKEGQDTIWYLTAPSRAEALSSPHLEAFKSKGWDVLLLTDPVDEWLVQALTEFEDIPLKSVSRGELDLEDSEDDASKADLTGLTPWMSEQLSGAVAGVRGSSRLTDSACVLVDDEDGISGNMERILRAANQDVPTAQRYLEVNPKHPLIQSMVKLHESGQTEALRPLAQLLLDDAMLMDGNVSEPAAIGRRLQSLLQEAAANALR
ncbi:MAG: molecular chaperone HtpG [Deltaproteobacteria bacterium]|nr:molecular chaperone HtpG [Deltaproteobacteria bacterium]